MEVQTINALKSKFEIQLDVFNYLISGYISSPLFDGISDYINKLWAEVKVMLPSDHSCAMLSFEHIDLETSYVHLYAGDVLMKEYIYTHARPRLVFNTTRIRRYTLNVRKSLLTTSSDKRT